MSRGMGSDHHHLRRHDLGNDEVSDALSGVAMRINIIIVRDGQAIMLASILVTLPSTTTSITVER